jgi:protein-disulfide isomerase
MSRLTVPVDPARDHIRGPVDARVTMVEYGDFECPFCGEAEVVLQELERELGDLLAVVFRHFPLATVHPHAELAAEASEAASAQGRFWEMHDILFANQQALEPTDLVEYAASLGLDVHRFARDLEGHRHLPRVREDFASGVRSGVNGTPSFFINGVRHNGSYDAASLLASISHAAATAERAP